MCYGMSCIHENIKGECRAPFGKRYGGACLAEDEPAHPEKPTDFPWRSAIVLEDDKPLAGHVARSGGLYVVIRLYPGQGKTWTQQSTGRIGESIFLAAEDVPDEYEGQVVTEVECPWCGEDLWLWRHWGVYQCQAQECRQYYVMPWLETPWLGAEAKGQVI